MKPLFFLIFMAGIGNTVLRPELENPLTLYRILAPIGILAMFWLRPVFVVKGLAWFLLFAVYNFALATLYSGDYTQLLAASCGPVRLLWHEPGPGDDKWALALLS